AGSSLPAWAVGGMSAGQSAYDLTGNVQSGKESTTNAGNALNDLLVALLGREGQQGGQASSSSSRSF
ncbi:hypothetical protein, partial [uncultured Akkermansia sp.]|uniref:hypothetical protein n=1 Tax=uncultured Akkermansia sp. TaxID=512294 RepID=UPI0025F5A16A